MELQYKPDWETTKQNYLAWWEREYFGRCAIAVTAPKNGVALTLPPLPDKVEDRWLDFGYLTALNEYWMQSTFYGGEAFPLWHPGYPGNAGHATLLGCKIDLKEDTGWAGSIIEDGDLTSHDYNTLKIDKEGSEWKFFCEVRELAVRESIGKCIPGNLAFGACGDTLATLRGSENLLTDVLECPDYIREFEEYLMRQWTELYEASYSITRECAGGSTCWFPLWSPGKFYAAQNDFAYMISADMFNEMFLSSLEIQTNYLDHTVYHVDGVDNFRHIDALLGLERLQAYQVLPGAGKPSPLHYPDVLKKVQDHKRNLHISIPADEVGQALDLLSARGLFIQTSCGSESDARDLIKCVEKWSVDRG